MDDSASLTSQIVSNAPAPLTDGARNKDHGWLNLRHLKAFSCVAHLRNISKASEEVNLSQPAISQAILSLEEEFGTKLFSRTPSGMHPSPAGKILLGRVDRAFDLMAHELRDAAPRAGRRQREVFDPSSLLRAGQISVLQSARRLGSLNACANELGLTIKSVNRHIRNLEERLGCDLLLRGASTITLTRAGDAICRAGQLFFREIDLARDEIAAEFGIASGKLVVGAMPLTRSYIVPKAMVAVANRHPGIQISLLEGTYSTLLRGLRNGEIDMLVGALRDPPEHDDVEQHVLFMERLCVVCRQEHPGLAEAADGSFSMTRYPWVAPRKGSPARAQFDNLFRDVNDHPTVLLEAASHMAVRSVLLESECLALLSRHQIRYEARAGQLQVIPIDVPQMDRLIGYTLRKSWITTSLQAEFINELHHACETSLSPDDAPEENL